MGEFAWTFTHEKIGNCFECFSLVNNLSHCRMMEFTLFGNGLTTLPKLMGNNNCFSMITVDVFPPWHCANAHLNVPDQKTVKTTAFIEVGLFADDQITQGHLISSTWLLFSLLIPMKAVRLYSGASLSDVNPCSKNCC